MTLRDTLALALDGTVRTPLRSVLTGIGVAVAVTVLTLLMGLGLGVQKVAADLITTEDTLTTMKVFSRHDPRWHRAPSRDIGDDEIEGPAPGLDDVTVERLAAAPGVRFGHRDVALLALLRRADGAEAKARTPWERRAQVIGLWPGALPADAATRFAEGGLPAPDQRRGLVLSHEAAQLLRPKDGGSLVGTEVLVEGAASPGAEAAAPEPLRCTVTGVLKNRQRLVDLLTMMSPMAFGTRRTVYLPAADAAGLGTGLRGFADLFRGEGGEPTLPAGASSSATLAMVSPLDAVRVRAVAETAGFRAIYAGDILRRAGVLFSIADGLLAGLGLVALLIASLGIANTMLVAVLERTREIGLLKSLGARDREVAMWFLVEAAVLGAAGGLVGCLLGLALGEGASAVVNAHWIVPSGGEEARTDLFRMPVWIWAGALGISEALTLLAAWYPSRRAARVDPIRALRYE